MILTCCLVGVGIYYPDCGDCCSLILVDSITDSRSIYRLITDLFVDSYVIPVTIYLPVSRLVVDSTVVIY